MPGLNTWSLRRRLAAAIAVLATILFGLVITAVVLLISLRSQQHAVINRYFSAVSVANRRFLDQINAETAVRGYALTGRPVTLQPFRAIGTPSYTAEASQLRTLLAGDRDVMQAFDGWDEATNTWYARSARPTIAETTAHGGRAVTDRQVLAGKALFDANRRQYAAFSAALVSKRNAASDDLRFRTTLLFAAAISVVAALAVTGGLSWWALRRWVLDPLADLGAETRVVRGGGLDHAVSVDGPAEIQRLAVDIDDMRADIVEQLGAVERARSEIEVARELAQTQAQELERSNRDLEQFAYVASHDLQEPLRKVASFCQMLERRYADQLDERAQQYIAFAVDGSKRMQQLINDLLAFSRVGRTQQALSEVDMQACLSAALDNLSVLIEASGVRVDADPMPRVRGDAVLLTQLLQNLLGNAIKFHGTEPPRIRITAQPDGELWEFGCADNGLGIEPQYADRIFVIFQRLHGKDEYAGTGIGLALCKRIVEYHGGTIWLDTSTAVGATFRWTLQRQPRPSLETT